MEGKGINQIIDEVADSMKGKAFDHTTDLIIDGFRDAFKAGLSHLSTYDPATEIKLSREAAIRINESAVNYEQLCLITGRKRRATNAAWVQAELRAAMDGK